METVKVVFSERARDFITNKEKYKGIGDSENWSPRTLDDIYKLPEAIHPQLYLKEAPSAGPDAVCHIDLRELPIVDLPPTELRLQSFIVAVKKSEDGVENRKIFRNPHYPLTVV